MAGVRSLSVLSDKTNENKYVQLMDLVDLLFTIANCTSISLCLLQLCLIILHSRVVAEVRRKGSLSLHRPTTLNVGHTPQPTADGGRHQGESRRRSLAGVTTGTPKQGALDNHSSVF